MRGALARAVLAELVGSALLAAAVVGSGAAAQRLSPQQPGLQLLETSVATGAALVALITALGPVSAAFNPLVTVAERLLGALTTAAAAAVVSCQLVGCCAGVVLANLMFHAPALGPSHHERGGGDVWLAESVASFGLLLVVFGVVRAGRTERVAVAVGSYIAAAYWFTSSTSFANPALTAARALTSTFAGIRAASVPAFVLAQLLGGGLAVLVVRALYPDAATRAEELVELGAAAVPVESR